MIHLPGESGMNRTEASKQEVDYAVSFDTTGRKSH